MKGNVCRNLKRSTVAGFDFLHAAWIPENWFTKEVSLDVSS